MEILNRSNNVDYQPLEVGYTSKSTNQATDKFLLLTDQIIGNADKEQTVETQALSGTEISQAITELKYISEQLTALSENPAARNENDLATAQKSISIAKAFIQSTNEFFHKENFDAAYNSYSIYLKEFNIAKELVNKIIIVPKSQTEQATAELENLKTRLQSPEENNLDTVISSSINHLLIDAEKHLNDVKQFALINDPISAYMSYKKYLTQFETAKRTIESFEL